MKDDFEFEKEEKYDDIVEVKEEHVKEDEKEIDENFDPEYEEEKITEFNEHDEEIQGEFQPEYDEESDEKNVNQNPVKQEEKSREEAREEKMEEIKEKIDVNPEDKIKTLIKEKIYNIKEKMMGKDAGSTIQIREHPKEKGREKTPNIKIRMNQKLKIPKQPKGSISPPLWFAKWIEEKMDAEKKSEPEKKEGSIFVKTDEELKREVLELLYKKSEVDRRTEHIDQ